MARNQLSSVTQGNKGKDDNLEEEGGSDLIGPRPQDGRVIQRKEMKEWTEEWTG